MKLWQKNYSVDRAILDYCTGNDFILDRELVKFDVEASIAHGAMLKKLGILSGSEFNKIKKCLNQAHKLKISKDDEDCHTAIENFLTRILGDLGKKIHTARSRNDQVLAALRLYAKEKIGLIANAAGRLANTLLAFARANEFVPIPGYTHTRKAMPSSVGLWAGAFVEAMIDDLTLLKTAYDLNNQSPLGSASGYGVSLPIDRNFTAKILGFDKVQNNTLYVQNSRGKFESAILNAASQIMLDLNKIATDIIFFASEGLDYFILPEKFCTGSSLMPNKKNPDVLELVRANYSVVLSYEFCIKSILANLPSGYNRDFQSTKEPFMRGLEITLKSLEVISLVIFGLKVDAQKCQSAITSDMFATDEALRLAQKGVPFRDAYKQIANKMAQIGAQSSMQNIKSKRHIGATGNLGLGKLKAKIAQAVGAFK